MSCFTWFRTTPITFARIRFNAPSTLLTAFLRVSPGARDNQHAIRGRGHLQSLGETEQRGSIENHQIEILREIVQQVGHARANQIRGAVRWRTRRQNRQVGPALRAYQHVAPLHLAHQHVGEANLRRHSEFTMHAGPPQIAIHQQRPLALQGVGHGQMNRRSGLPLGRAGAGNQNGSQTGIDIAQQNRVAQRADRLTEAGNGPIIALAIVGAFIERRMPS